MHDSRDRRRRTPGGAAVPGRAGTAPGTPGKATLVGATPGLALPSALRARLERALAADLSAVRVGEDPRVAAMGARAVASGTTVLFAPGAYQPDSPHGQELIAHEVVHLTQQADRPTEATHAIDGTPVHHDPALEHAADDIAARALRGEVVRTSGPSPIASAAPVQGFFGDLGSLIGKAVDKVVETVKTAVHTVSHAVDPALSEDDAGSFELQRMLDSESIAAVGAAYDALIDAQGTRVPGQPVDIVRFTAEGVDHDLEVAPTVTDAMVPVFRARRDELAMLPPDESWEAFAEGFDRELKPILHVFDLAEIRDDLSRKRVSAARLRFLFTAGQREKLTGYFADHMIPDRLFDGDEVGHATAQQRIMLASKILADGKIQPGSWVQEVHARACYHWARLVYEYAGVATRGETTNQGIVGAFDVLGGLLLGGGKKTELDHAERNAFLDPTDEHLLANPKAYRYGNTAWDKVRQLQPGDWIYVYNGNASGPGAHSVIFSGWAGPEGFDAVAAKYYRAAHTYDQSTKESGGNQHTVILGEDVFAVATGGHAIPVNEIFRVTPGSQPITNADDLTPVLGHRTSDKNQSFIAKLERKSGKKFSTSVFLEWLRTANSWSIGKLVERDRLTPGQHTMFATTNASDTVHDVVCLYERLHVAVVNSEALADNTDATYSLEVELKRAAENADYNVDATVLRAEIGLRELELLSIEGQTEVLRDQIRELEQVDELAALGAELRQRRKEMKHLAGLAARKAKLAEIDAVKAKIAAAKGERADHRAEVKAIEAELEPFERREHTLEREIAARERQLGKLVPSTIFGLAHNANSKGQIKGKDYAIDGRYSTLPGHVPWDTFLVDP